MTDRRQIRLKYEDLDTLLEHPDNPKAHDLDALEASVDRFGYITPIVVNDRDGAILEGHGRLQLLKAMRDRGEDPPPGIGRSRGAWTVPVIRGVDLDADDARAFLVAANRTSEIGGWNEERLAALLGDLRDRDQADATGYSPRELDKLLGALRTPAAKTDPDDVPDDAEPRAQLYDVWRLGDHFLLCRDATDLEGMRQALDTLLGGEPRVAAVVTDPPYAIYGSSTGTTSSITDDKIVRPFFRDVLRLAEGTLKLFGHAYVFCDWRSWPSWWEVAKAVPRLEPKNAIVWDKAGSGLGSNWANTYELVGFFTRMPEQKAMTADRARGQRAVLRSNVLRYNRPTGDDRLHNAAKPVDLLAELITAATDEGETVLDPFAGSGSTLIACELSRRRCITVDVDPHWVDTTLARWERLTGRQAERLHP